MAKKELAYNPVVVAGRLKDLRESKGFTLEKMALLLEEKIGIDHPHSKYKAIAFRNKTNNGAEGDYHGRSIVKQIETARAITLPIAWAYSTIFSVSVDYTYGFTDEPNPGDKEIICHLGLSPKAILILRETNKKQDHALQGFKLKCWSEVINFLFENPDLINALFDYYFIGKDIGEKSVRIFPADSEEPLKTLSNSKAKDYLFTKLCAVQRDLWEQLNK